MSSLKQASFLAGLLTGCSLYTKPWAYDEVELAPQLDALRAGCASCIERSCPSFYAACERSDACVNHAACLAEDLSVAGLQRCGGNEQFEYGKVLQCKSCEEACSIGTQLQCTGRFGWPIGESKVHLQQRFVSESKADSGKPIENALLRVCGGTSTGCGADTSLAPSSREKGLIAWQELSDGWADLELDAQPRDGGFVGYFVLDGDGIPTYRIHSTRPYVSGSNLTKLFMQASIDMLKGAAENLCLFEGGLTIDLQNAATVLFQANDCLGSPAPDLTVRAVDAPESFVLYQEGEAAGCPGTRGTRVAGGAAGAILNLSANRPQVLVEIASGDRVVSRATVTTVPGQITVLTAYPLSSSEIEAWSE